MNRNVEQLVIKTVTTIKLEKKRTVKTKKATFILDTELHTRLKKEAAIEGCNMADIVTIALRTYLNGDE